MTGPTTRSRSGAVASTSGPASSSPSRRTLLPNGSDTSTSSPAARAYSSPPSRSDGDAVSAASTRPASTAYGADARLVGLHAAGGEQPRRAAATGTLAPRPVLQPPGSRRSTSTAAASPRKAAATGLSSPDSTAATVGRDPARQQDERGERRHRAEGEGRAARHDVGDGEDGAEGRAGDRPHGVAQQPRRAARRAATAASSPVSPTPTPAMTYGASRL